ncbi:hypothetical protein E6P78_31495 [Streptomyces sp. A0958]|uniref:hypothetical protein n=1 Tax=Streptomyces sp. A0958 TaxID=2563101 RepID=UPI00109E4C96|nr:hypothetical protein [Streptomyces sp. A0958]THA57112.1 hypothetical protein E6P78_31495 [Streptomyces sp. A0958]
MPLSSTNPLAFRAVLTVPHTENALGDVRRLCAQWLGRKFGAAPLASGHHHLDDESVLTNQAAYLADGAEHALRIQLREDRDTATWRTTVTAAVFEDTSALVSVDLEAFRNGDAQISPGRPGLIPDLVRDLKPTDGMAPLALGPQDIRADDVDVLIDILCDPGRRMPVLVAANPLRADELWSRRMNKAMSQSAGFATLYLLVDPEAVDAFRLAIGEHHRVAPGAVRTFLPEVDPAWPTDGSRHRYITMARMSNARDVAWFGLARRIQQIAAEAPLPDALRHLALPDQAVQRRRVREDALAAVRPGDELTGLRADVAELKELLAQADEEIKEAVRTAELSARTVASLEEQRRVAVEQGRLDLEDAFAALDEAERARAEADVLRRRLREAGRYEETVVATPPPGAPDSFEELWERLGVFEGILVTADKDKALELDEGDRARVWAAKAWNALRSLDSYAQAAKDDFRGGFYQFCTSDRAGAVIWPLKQYASGETETTMQKWGRERIFPVPKALHDSKLMEMTAHLKLGSKGSTSPRIYFLDDTQGMTGQVVVGYVGPHLTNTKT